MNPQRPRSTKGPNVIYVFADQWRWCDTGYAGNPQVRTPHLDAFAAASINFTHAVAGCPVCSPARASMMTGRYPTTHGVFVNDVPLSTDAVSLAQAFAAGGYDTAYIGKWHIDGHGRSNYIPPERRQGFDYWKVLECTHSYNESYYYDGNDPTKRMWEGYDAIAQTDDAAAYVRDHADADKPFLLVLSWGPPHAPYETAPKQYRDLYRPEDIELRPNVPPEMADKARQWIAGYYAHCTALDDCFASLLKTIDEAGIADDTVVIFTSDHGDMLGSQGEVKKQRPWEESIRVPMLARVPGGPAGKALNATIDTADLMPTMLGLAGLPNPDTVEGHDFSGYMLRGEDDPSKGAAVLNCVHPFGQFTRDIGGREYRGLRTGRYTYVRDLNGPWLLYDNENDPYQLTNLADDPTHAALRAELDADLDRRLAARGDRFEPSEAYLAQWGYEVDEKGTVPYTW